MSAVTGWAIYNEDGSLRSAQPNEPDDMFKRHATIKEVYVVPVDELDTIIAEKLKAFSERVSDRLLAKRDQEDSRLRGHHTGLAFEKAAAIVRQEADNA